VSILSAAARAVPLMCLCLAGCSGLFQSKVKPEQIYYLRASGAASTPAAAPPAAMPVSIRVGRPVADPGLDTPHIMLVQADHRMNFYSGSRWPAPASELIEALAVQTLRASGEWASVEDSASPFPSDYLLQLHVRRFEADYTSGSEAPRTDVVLDCIVGRRQGREVLATFTVSGAAAASTNRLGEVVAAFEQATSTALDMLAQQSARAVRLDAQRAAPNGEPPLPAINR
jgi:cholesterol transport system auxiliary component